MKNIDFVKSALACAKRKEYSNEQIVALKNKIDSNIESQKVKFTLCFDGGFEFDVYIKCLNTTVENGFIDSNITVFTINIEDTVTINLQYIKDIK
jgi:hypothetical protein